MTSEGENLQTRIDAEDICTRGETHEHIQNGPGLDPCPRTADRPLDHTRHDPESGLSGKTRGGLRLYKTTERYEETIYFQQTYAGEGDAFAGLMSHHHGYVHHGKKTEQPNCSIFKYGVSDKFEQIKWMMGDGALDEGEAYPYGIYRWFACDRWRLVYENDAEGNGLFGDTRKNSKNVYAGA